MSVAKTLAVFHLETVRLIFHEYVLLTVEGEHNGISAVVQSLAAQDMARNL